MQHVFVDMHVQEQRRWRQFVDLHWKLCRGRAGWPQREKWLMSRTWRDLRQVASLLARDPIPPSRGH